MNLPGLRAIRGILETVEWQAHQWILSHDFDFRLAEVEEEQEVFEPSPAERRGPAGDSPPEVCDDGPLRQSPSGGRPISEFSTSELLMYAAIAIDSWSHGVAKELVNELCERAEQCKKVGD